MSRLLPKPEGLVVKTAPDDEHRPGEAVHGGAEGACVGAGQEAGEPGEGDGMASKLSMKACTVPSSPPTHRHCPSFAALS